MNGAGGGQAAEGGAAVVEFVLVSALAVILAMSLAQLGLFPRERNALMGSLSEGTRVAATEGRDGGRRTARGHRTAATLDRRAGRGRGPRSMAPRPTGIVVLLLGQGTLLLFVPGFLVSRFGMTARMHEEETAVTDREAGGAGTGAAVAELPGGDADPAGAVGLCDGGDGRRAAGVAGDLECGSRGRRGCM